MTLFIYNFKFEDSVRAWDYIITRGALRAIPELILGFISMKSKILTKYIEKICEIFSQGETIEIDMGYLLNLTS